MNKPAPAVTMPIPAIPRPVGVILSQEGYQELGQALLGLRIKAFVDRDAPPDFIEWCNSPTGYHVQTAGRTGTNIIP